MAASAEHADQGPASCPVGLYGDGRLAQYVETLDGIGAPEMAFFADYGYLAVRAAFTAADVQSAIAGLLSLLDREDFRGVEFEANARADSADLRSDEKQDHVRKLQGFADADPRLHALAFHEKLLAVLRQLVGAEPELFQSMALLKPPGGGREKPWHQDNAYFNLPWATPVVGAWIALDPATPENGCMHVIPGSHQEGPVVHFRRRDWQICDRDVPLPRDTVVPLPPGGCLLFHGLTQHGTPPNRSGLRRRALQFHYRPSGTPGVSDGERLSVFGSEGKDARC